MRAIGLTADHGRVARIFVDYGWFAYRYCIDDLLLTVLRACAPVDRVLRGSH